MTRATGRLLRGDLAGSWHQNPFLLIALAQVVLLSGVSVIRPALLTGGRASRLQSVLGRHASYLLLANGVACLAIWVARLASGSIPAPFS